MRHLSQALVAGDLRRECFWSVEPRFVDMELRGDSTPPAVLAAPALAAAEEQRRLASDRYQGPAGQQSDAYAMSGGVAEIRVEGVLMKRSPFWARYYGIKFATMVDMSRAVEAAANDAAVNSIVLLVDSPGGTVSGVSDLADAVYAARKKKPVIAYISDLGASAAYYVASQADKIYTDVDALVGSIGTYMVVQDLSQMAKDMGIKVHVIRAGEFKGAGTPGTELTDAQLADFQREISGVNEPFLRAVSRGREMPMDQVRKLNDGRVHVGKDAMELGLTDGVKSYASVMKEAVALSRNGGAKSDLAYITWRRGAAEHREITK